MTTLSPAPDQTHSQQNSTNNPALNDQAFRRAVDRSGAQGETGMTVRGTYLKTGLLLLLLILAGAWGWSQVRIETVSGQLVAIPPGWMFLAFLLTFIFGIAAIFAGRWIWLMAIGYTLSYGSLLGVTSHYFNLLWDGIVLEAIVVTIAVFAGTWLLYTTGIIKVTRKLTLVVMIGMSGLLLLFLTAWFLSLFGVNFSYLNQPTAAGILFSLFIVVLAALNLPLDFDFIKRASASGAPKHMEWYGAYGLILSTVWMYVSVLRLLAILRMRSR